MSGPIWKCPKGDSRTIRFAITTDGTALDLTGYAITMKATAMSGGTPVLTQTWTGSGSSNDLVLDPAKTAAVTAGRYWACIEASKAASPGPYTQIGWLEIQAHP